MDKTSETQPKKTVNTSGFGGYNAQTEVTQNPEKSKAAQNVSDNVDQEIKEIGFYSEKISVSQ